MTTDLTVSMFVRIVIVVIDILFYISVATFLAFILSGNTSYLPDPAGWMLPIGYILFFHCYLHQTPGMRFFGCRFVNTSLEKPASWKMILRCVAALFFSTIVVGAIIAVFTYNKESGFFWDRWFKIKMIQARPPLF